MSKSILTKLTICIVFIIILSNSICSPVSHALSSFFSDAKGFLDDGNEIEEVINMTQLEDTSDTIYNTLLAIAIMVAIVVAMILGIQFMIASADEKAKVKEAILPFVIGCIVVFGAFTIWKVAVNIGNNAEESVDSSSPGSHSGATPNISGYVCNYCNQAVGDIPYGVLTGGRDYNCPNCHKKIVEKGKITGAVEK